MTSAFEFINYKSTPEDAYMLGIATVRLYGKIILKYKHIKTKDGTSNFFAAPNYQTSENGEKKYVTAFMLDSRGDDDMLMEFVRDNVKKAGSVQSAFNLPKKASGVAEEQEELPF